MKKQDKAQLVELLAEQFTQANTVYLSDYKGLDVPNISEIRSQLKKDSFTFKVVKNSIIELAAEKAGFSDLVKGLQGPTAVTIGDDPVTPAKIISDFSKESGLPAFKMGLVEGVVYEPSDIKRFSDLPSRDELLAKAVGSIAAPLSGLVGTLDGVISKFVRVVNAIAEQKKEQ